MKLQGCSVDQLHQFKASVLTISSHHQKQCVVRQWWIGNLPLAQLALNGKIRKIYTKNKKTARDFPTALENLCCCFDHYCSLLSQSETGAIIWARCKYIGTSDEVKAYTTGRSPSSENSLSTESGGMLMVCKCVLLNKGVPPDQILSTLQKHFAEFPRTLPDVLKPFLQFPCWSSAWFPPGEKD